MQISSTVFINLLEFESVLVESSKNSGKNKKVPTMSSLQALFLGLAVISVTFRIIEAQTIHSDEVYDYDDVEPTTIRNLNTSQIAPLEQHPVRIVAVGRSRSGVSSTIRELIGPFTKCVMPEGTETLQNIYEYTISQIPGTTSSIKIADIPGFVDGRTLEQDSQILATLKSYLSKLGDPPDYFLASTRFDDKRITGSRSLFGQFLKRIELFKNEFLERLSPKEMNVIFLLTRLMSETGPNQRNPAKKIKSFHRVIEDHSTLPQPYHIVVGDNQAKSEYNVSEEEGYYRLPNRELYPKNIWEAMINATTSSEADDTMGPQNAPVLKTIMDNRQVEMKCEVKLIQTDWEEYDSDTEAFLYLLNQPEGWTIEENEVNLEIEQVFNNLSLISTKVDGIIQKTALQLLLQNKDITSIPDLPTSYTDRAGFFQMSSLISSSYPALLLNDSFGLEMPEYSEPLSVGYGYDVLGDEILLNTPFKSIRTLPSTVGYKLPNFINCRNLPNHEVITFLTNPQNISDYFAARISHLHFETTEDIINLAKFSGRIEEGYNIIEEEPSTLTAVKEVRSLKCVLSEREDLDEEFMAWISVLEPVDLYSRDSIMKWENFFKKYGTHIVVEGYGGGKMVVSIAGPNIRNVMESPPSIEHILDSILKGSDFSVPGLERPQYELHGGVVESTDQEISQLYDMPKTQRNRILDAWDQSLNSNFDMLKMELSLERISTVVREKIDANKGAMVDQAIELFLRGDLKRKWRTRNISGTLNRSGGHRGNVRSRLGETSSTTTQPSRLSSQGQGAYPLNNGPQSSDLQFPTAFPFPTHAYSQPSFHFHPQPGSNFNILSQQVGRHRIDAQAQIDNIRRMNEESNARHQAFSKQVVTETRESQRQQEELSKNRDQNREWEMFQKTCNQGLGKLLPHCWSDKYTNDFLTKVGIPIPE